MLKQLTLTVALLALTAPVAHAQSPGAPDSGVRMAQADGPRAGERERGRGRHDGPRGYERGGRGGHERGGPRGHHRGHGGMMAGSGFELNLGGGRSLRVRCGDTELAECMEAAQPLVDSMSEMGGPRGGPEGRPRPMRGGPDAPPPPPPGGGDRGVDVPMPEGADAGGLPPAPGSLQPGGPDGAPPPPPGGPVTPSN